MYKLWTLLISLFCLAPLHANNDSDSQSPNYRNMDVWLCHPDKKDNVCDRDLSTSIISADGTVTIETWPNPSNPPIDCFYVYPTTSLDKTGNSDLIAESPGEITTTFIQAARFRSTCRVFAPMYRQLTVAAIRGEVPWKWQIAFGDVLSAWQHYLAHENNGRGIVLIGHSQGSAILRNLLLRHIDGKPIQKQLVSAILAGPPNQELVVPAMKSDGGPFKNISVCEYASQIGCVIAFASYRDSQPPRSTAMFARNKDGGIAVCTNPAGLAGGEGALNVYLSTRGEISTSVKPYAEWVHGTKILTPFVSLPKLLFAECVATDDANYLEIRVKRGQGDPRTNEIVGDKWDGTKIDADWGLHIMDISLTLGNLVDIVSQQANAYIRLNR